MFANALRSQARLGCTAVRPALSVARTLSGLAGTRVAVAAPSSLARLVLSPRAFTQSAPVFNENQEHLQESDTDTIFVGNLPWSATRNEIKGLFSEFGQVVDVGIQTHADGRPRGFAHVTFENVKNSVAAVLSATEKPIHIGGRDLVVNYARPKAIPKHNNEPNEKLYFSGFAEGEDALRELMKDVEEEIVSIQFARHGNTGETLPAGFVEFRTIESATDALKRFDETEMEGGAKLFLTYARPKKPRIDGQGSSYNYRIRRNRESLGARSYRPSYKNYQSG